jgi:3-oxoacyl-[acyl-carrier protein] reductase
MEMNAPDDCRLRDRVAIVTGVGEAGSIGRAISLRYAREGASVALLDVDERGPSSVADEIVSAGGKAIALECDVTNLTACEAAAARVAEAWGDRVDILVNNAAIMDVVWQPFDQWTTEQWDRVMQVNLRGMWFTSRAFVPLMKERGYGKIINIASATFFEGVGGFVHYSSSKGGVIGFTRALGRELGEAGIRVNAIAPGYTLSETQKEHVAGHPEHAVNIRSRRALAKDEVPEDLAGPAFFLASQDSDFMTCQTILVEGGGSMW